MRNFLLLIVSVIVGGLGYFWVASPVRPVAWQPQPAPAMTGVLAPNTALQQADILGAGQIDGPEDVDVDSKGRVYGGDAEGQIQRISGLQQGGAGQVETFADTGGRPLGLAFDNDGNLIVADAVKGLLSIEPNGKVNTLTTSANGKPFGFTDDVDVGIDGDIYFSDASDKWGVNQYKMDLLEMQPHGRLLRYIPATGKTEVLLDHLYFANGVAVSKDGDYVLVNETWAYRVTRYWLKGPKAGTSDVFADNLPGFPDGISRGWGLDGKQIFWVAMFAPRNAQLDSMQPHPWIKRIVAKLPQALQPKPVKNGMVLALDGQGKIIKSLQDPAGGHLYEITSVQQSGDMLYFGSLHDDRIGRLATARAFAQP